MNTSNTTPAGHFLIALKRLEDAKAALIEAVVSRADPETFGAAEQEAEDARDALDDACLMLTGATASRIFDAMS